MLMRFGEERSRRREKIDTCAKTDSLRMHGLYEQSDLLNCIPVQSSALNLTDGESNIEYDHLNSAPLDMYRSHDRLRSRFLPILKGIHCSSLLLPL